MKPAYIYKAELIRVIDGDTLRLRVHCGFRITFEDNFRLLGFNAPEIRGPEKSEGLAVKAKLESFLQDKELLLESSKHGAYRWLARVWADGEDLEGVIKSWIQQSS